MEKKNRELGKKLEVNKKRMTAPEVDMDPSERKLNQRIANRFDMPRISHPGVKNADCR